MGPDVKIGLCKCKEGRKIFGIRFEEYENKWKATWSFPIKKEGAGKREGYEETSLKGDIIMESEYPGCPYCGARGLVICGKCGGLNCNMNMKHEQFCCGWCEMTGDVVDYTGDGFNAGGDR